MLRRSQYTGEPFVWLTSIGLATGLLMIVFLLAVIAYNGIAVFWPKRIVELTLRPDSGFALGEQPRLAGEVVKKRQRLVRSATTDEAEEEWQLFIGNRDVYGASFKYIDADAIVATAYPPDYLQLERLEYGDAIGVPVRLQLDQHGAVAYNEAAFEARLREVVAAAAQRRVHIRRIEKHAIGRLNAELEQLRLRQRILERQNDAAALDELKAKTRELQQRYETLAAQARQLRELQHRDTLRLRLASGQERDVAVGDIVYYSYPNQLGWAQRLAVFARNCWVFVWEEPREANTEGGIFPAIFGTFVMTLIMSVVVMPFGVLAAIYLREYAKQGVFVRAVRIAVNNLAGVPSIVFGVFGLGFFVYYTGGSIDQLFFEERLPTPTFGTGGILWAGLTLALMTVPVVIVSTEEGLAAVPRGVRDASLALGASKWQTIQRVVLPAASPGMLTGLILAMARGAGEVAPLMLVGVVKLAPSLPVDTTFPFVHLERKFMHLGFHIYDLGFQSPDAEAAKPMVFTTTLLLIMLVVVLNLSAIIIRERLRQRYARAGV